MNFTSRIGVFGGREVDEALYKETIEIGQWLAKKNCLVFCGGAEGVMEAISRGINEENGTVIGILKGMDYRESNNYIGIPISTGMGIGRNPLITYNCDLGIAIGGKYGTLSEIAYMMQLNKPVIGYKSWLINGMDQAITVKDLLSKLESHIHG